MEWLSNLVEMKYLRESGDVVPNVIAIKEVCISIMVRLSVFETFFMIIKPILLQKVWKISPLSVKARVVYPEVSFNRLIRLRLRAGSA